MPTYQYICENGHEYQEIRGMTEDQTRSTCAEPGCSAKLKRKFSAPPITFKGGGFSSNRG
jgi:putative FmdB family regulatory protein